MMKIMLIDDERPALRELEFLLGTYDDVEVVGAYTNPEEAIEVIKELEQKPQAVFLDINMPVLMGTDAASLILDEAPETSIVFVTAYDIYAVEAFELTALDYVLKPLSKERMDKTLNRLRIRTSEVKKTGNHRLKINCLGKFKVWLDDCEPLKWRTEKTQELFAYLLFKRGQQVKADELIDVVWPETDPQRASAQLHNAVYYIRKTLQDYGIVSGQLCLSGSYCLHLENGDLDIDCLQAVSNNAKSTKEIALYKKYIGIYSGQLFEGSGWQWSEPERERLEREYLNFVSECARMQLEEGEYSSTEELLLNAYHADPYLESTTKLLLELYIQSGERAKATKHYQGYCKMLKDELNILPCDDIRRIGNNI